MRILVAEDNHFYRCLLRDTLSGWGYEVVTAADGREAWDLLQAPDRPRLAIIDWMMPGLDGLELCRRVRGVAEALPVYLILLTAKDGRDNTVAGLRAGADDYICKPFDVEELRARLQVGLRIVDLQARLADRVKHLECALTTAQKMEAVGRLAGGVAHDFNNLLTVVLGCSDVLLCSLTDPPQREMAQLIKESGERGALLTRQLLAFSRRQILRPEVLQLNNLVVNLERILRRLIGEDIELSTDLAPDLGCVTADPGQLEQVLMNLVVNARDAMPDGGRLTLATHNADAVPRSAVPPPPGRGGPYVTVAVTDTGCGMDEGTQAHLFEPFFTTKEQGKGTGLGLATVYGIVEQSGGHIEVDSAPGRGSTFRIFLPRAQAPAGAAADRPDGPAGRGNLETILLVEDEDPVRVMARHVLQTNNYTVLEARDGDEALRVSAAWPAGIDLMLTDLVMPRTSGRQLAERLQPERPGMKVLFMSGYTDDALVRNSPREPSRPFLQKPFTPTVLARKVREVLDN